VIDLALGGGDLLGAAETETGGRQILPEEIVAGFRNRLQSRPLAGLGRMAPRLAWLVEKREQLSPPR